MIDYMDMTIPFLDLPLPKDSKSIDMYNKRFQAEYEDNPDKKNHNKKEYEKAQQRVIHVTEQYVWAYWEKYGLPKPHPLPEEHEYDDYDDD